MSDEHKAIKVNTAGSSYSGKVDITNSFADDSIIIRLNGVPSELKYTVPPSMQIDIYDSLRDEFEDKLKQIHDKYGAAVYKKASSDIVSKIRWKIYGLKSVLELDEHFKAEVTEIIDHFETLMKAHLIDYAANRYKTLQKAIADMSAQAHKELNDVIDRGEEAIPHDTDEESA